MAFVSALTFKLTHRIITWVYNTFNLPKFTFSSHYFTLRVTAASLDVFRECLSYNVIRYNLNDVTTFLTERLVVIMRWSYHQVIIEAGLQIIGRYNSVVPQYNNVEVAAV